MPRTNSVFLYILLRTLRLYVILEGAPVAEWRNDQALLIGLYDIVGVQNVGAADCR